MEDEAIEYVDDYEEIVRKIENLIDDTRVEEFREDLENFLDNFRMDYEDQKEDCEEIINNSWKDSQRALEDEFDSMRL